MTLTPDREATSAAALTKVQKLAVLLLILQPDSAAEILKNLEEEELAAVAFEMTEMKVVDAETQAAVLSEFGGVALKAAAAINGGVDRTQGLLEKGIGLFKASEILGRISPSPPPVAAMKQLADMEPRHLFNLLRREQPQTIAMVACYLSPEKLAQVLSLMRPELREQVIICIGSISATSVDALEAVVEVLQAKQRNLQPRAMNQSGGTKMAAQVLNSLDKSVSKSLLLSIEERNPELARAISQKMFTFEDLARLEAKALQKIMQEANKNDLVIALKLASEKNQAALLACLSKRASETIREEMAFMGTVSLKDVEAAQIAIIEIAKRLEASGDIDLGSSRSGSAHPRAA